MLTVIDKDYSGHIDQAETDAFFFWFDTDRSQFLTAPEFAAAIAAGAFRLLDADRDGRAGRAEILAHRAGDDVPLFFVLYFAFCPPLS